MDIFFKNDGSYSQSTVGIPVLVDYTPVGFVREVNADMVTCSLFDKFIGKEWLAQRLTTKEPDICLLGEQPQWVGKSQKVQQAVG